MDRKIGKETDPILQIVRASSKSAGLALLHTYETMHLRTHINVQAHNVHALVAYRVSYSCLPWRHAVSCPAITSRDGAHSSSVSWIVT